jgi:hypothetical protein
VRFSFHVQVAAVEKGPRALDCRDPTAFSAFSTRLAAQARTKSCRLGGVRLGEKRDVRAQCAPRRARRTAVDAGGANGKHKMSIKTLVARFDCAPCVVVAELEGIGRLFDRHGRHDLLSVRGNRKL